MHGFFENFRQAPSTPDFPIFPEQKMDSLTYKLKDTTILDFNTLKPMATSYQVINPFYASGSTSMVSHVKIASVEAIMKQATASEAAIYRTLRASPGVELPFLQPLGVAKEDPTLLFLPKLSCTLDELQSTIEGLKEVNLPRYEQALYALFAFGVDVLGALREKGIVHYDIKPENIGYDEQTKKMYLFDFGISVPIQNPGDAPEGDRGTPLYNWSPEYCNGIRTPAFAIESWSIGALLAYIRGGSEFNNARPDILGMWSDRVAAYMKASFILNDDELDIYHDGLERVIETHQDILSLYEFMCSALLNPDPEKRPTFYCLKKAQRKMENLLGNIEPDVFDKIYQEANEPLLISPSGRGFTLN